MHRTHSNALCLVLIYLLLSTPTHAEPEQIEGSDIAPSATAQIPPHPLLTELLSDPLTTDAEHRALRLNHGLFNQLDPTTPLTPNEQAQQALTLGHLTHPTLQPDATDANPLLRAEAAQRRGEPQHTLDLLTEDTTPQAAVLRAHALHDLGQTDDALAALDPLLDLATTDDPATETARGQALALRATLLGLPGNAYQDALDTLGHARLDLDPLHTPAHLAEARLLLSRSARAEGLTRLLETLSLNPSSAEAWALLGNLQVDTYNLATAHDILDKLKSLAPDNPNAATLQARLLLRERDPAAATAVVRAARSTYPQHRELAALAAACAALSYDDDALAAAHADYDALTPNGPLALYEAGDVLAHARQYPDARALLEQAVERAPYWAEPRLALGLMLVQQGDDAAALEHLAAACELDPFHVRAANQLTLVRELLTYDRIETDHFIIKHKPGIDAVLAADMAAQLEALHADITAHFGHTPPNKTTIDLMPDSQWFAVRITGLPELWTVAAATGDVLALTPPRTGPNLKGPFDWLNVVRHEFTHTVTLSQTRNRLPHWFTEACAVDMELGPRRLDTCRLLTQHLDAGTLFTLDTINQGFIRPDSPSDRALAYAQAHWMLQYLQETYPDRWRNLFPTFNQGRTTADALQDTLDLTPENFTTGFLAWADSQVESWGLTNPNAQALQASLNEQLNHLTRVADLQSATLDPILNALDQYAQLTPVDPWPHHARLRLAEQLDDNALRLAALLALDQHAGNDAAYAARAATLAQQLNDLDAAHAAITRALHREPYNPAFRERAAAIALQRDDPAEALRHLKANTLLEPDRSLHWTRYATLLHREGQHAPARAAAQQARTLNPNAPVGPIFGE